MCLRPVWYHQLYILELQIESPTQSCPGKEALRKKHCHVWCKFCSGRFRMSVLFVIHEYYFKSCGLPGSCCFPFMTFSPSFFKEKFSSPIITLSSFSWDKKNQSDKLMKGIEAEDGNLIGPLSWVFCSLKGKLGYGKTYPKWRNPGTSLRPVGKVDNLESRGFSGFL